jgi:hypothetical protein
MFKRILNGLKMVVVRFWGSPLMLRRAKKKADRLSREQNKRYRVYFMRGRYRAMTRLDVKAKKHAGDWNPNVNVTKLIPMQFYDTQSKN